MTFLVTSVASASTFTTKNNREAESISSAEQAGVANDGNVWGAVVKLLGGENEKLAKMRSLIVRLKHLNKPPLL